MQTAELKVSSSASMSITLGKQQMFDFHALDLKVLPSEKVEKELTSTDMFVRERAVQMYSLTEAQHERALKDSAWKVRMAAVEKGGLTIAQINRGMQDEHLGVADAVVRLG